MPRISKLRISLGLKPLEADSDDEGDKQSSSTKVDRTDEDGLDPLQNQDERAERNYAERQQELKRQKEEQAIRERIARAQNKRELSRKLKGPTLGDVDPFNADLGEEPGPDQSSGDTLKWLKVSRRRAKENAARRMKEEAEQEAALAQAAKYGAEDLKGLKVAHDVDDFDLEAGGEERILTLKDARVLDDDDDELMDAVLTTAERDRVNAERKKGAKEYTGLDDEEFDAAQVGKKRGVLSKYDADVGDADHFDRGAEGTFRLGGDGRERGGGDGTGAVSGPSSRRERAEEERRERDRMLNRTMLSVDYGKNNEVSDYLAESDVGFKKPKAKKKRKRETARVKLEDDEGDYLQRDMSNGVEVSSSASDLPTPPLRTENYIDDDELATSLARARREKAKKAYKKMTPEMIAQNLAAQREAEAAEEAQRLTASVAQTTDEGAEEGQGLTFDDTSEFVRNIDAGRQSSPDLRSSRRRIEDVKREASSAERPTVKKEIGITSEQAPGDAEMRQVDATALLNDPTVRIKEEELDEEMGYPEDQPPSIHLPEAEEEEQGRSEAEAEDPSEPLVSGGLASTLSILRNQGLIQEVTPEQRAREQEQKAYDHWLAVRRAEDQVRTAELAASKAQGSAKDQATREYENRQRELEDARRAQDKFRDYKPDIDIKYHDEFGRVLNNHEAWKRLSHTFHGRMPGKKKQEQRLQRIEEERKREKMLAGDTPSGMTKAFAERQERSGQAHMVLGVGAKNNAPQMMDILGPNTAPKAGAKNGDGGDKNARAKDKSRNSSGTAVVPAGAAWAPTDGVRSSSAGVASLSRSVNSPSLRADAAADEVASGAMSSAPANAKVSDGQAARPGMRPAFAPVKTRSPAPPSTSSSPSTTTTTHNGTQSPASGGGGLRLALNNKRPTAGASQAEPASKGR